LRGESSVARQHGKACPECILPSSAIADLPAGYFHADAWFAPQEELFASLTLRAARNYVRYSATLRSYRGFDTGYHAASRLEGAIGDLDAAGRW